jgi:hypothetical protein
VVGDPPSSHGEQPGSEPPDITVESRERLGCRHPGLGEKILNRVGGVTAHILRQGWVQSPEQQADRLLITGSGRREDDVEIAGVHHPDPIDIPAW